jgi:hypothetical protein
LAARRIDLEKVWLPDQDTSDVVQGLNHKLQVIDCPSFFFTKAKTLCKPRYKLETAKEEQTCHISPTGSYRIMSSNDQDLVHFFYKGISLCKYNQARGMKSKAGQLLENTFPKAVKDLFSFEKLKKCKPGVYAMLGGEAELKEA